MKNDDQLQHIVHPYGPVFNEQSKILILGSFPSVKSRENNFFYGHPQNRFWQVLAAVFESNTPHSIEEKKDFLLSRHIALWDVIHSCDIIGSDDSSIRNVEPSDLSVILRSCQIRCIFANGKTAEKFYNKLTRPLTGREIIGLPSTSPANAAFSLPKLLTAWTQIKDFV